MTQQITKDKTVNEVLKQFPKSIGVFNKFNIDSCCGGNRSIEQASREDKAVLEALLVELNKATG